MKRILQAANYFHDLISDKSGYTEQNNSIGEQLFWWNGDDNLKFDHYGNPVYLGNFLSEDVSTSNS